MFEEKNSEPTEFYSHFKAFHELMATKIREILLVSSPYDAFINYMNAFRDLKRAIERKVEILPEVLPDVAQIVAAQAQEAILPAR